MCKMNNDDNLLIERGQMRHESWPVAITYVTSYCVQNEKTTANIKIYEVK